jgi:hypothetical protein
MTLKQMREAANNGTAQELTIDLAKSLIGKKIVTIYFGYEGQDGIDEFVIGEIISEYDYHKTKPCDGYASRSDYWESYMEPSALERTKQTLTIITSDGRDTAIRVDKSQDSRFHCSDEDRTVLFLICE